MMPHPASPLRSPPTRTPTPRTGKSYLVTGGHGFLGSHLVEALLARGEDRVHIFDVAHSPLFAPEIASSRVVFHPGDLRNAAQVEAACDGIDTVFHTAALVDFWSDLPFEYAPIHAVNVLGTEHVIAACQARGVKQLAFTSSTSVVVQADILAHPLVFADETAPYARPPYLCHYVRTKTLAEQAVLSVNGHNGLCTGALRPGGLYGPRDPLLTRTLVERALGMGTKDNIVDFVYIENVAHAFLLLEQHLVPGDPACGRAYFITNYDPDQGGSESYLTFHKRFAARLGQRFRLAPASVMSSLAASAHAVAQVSQGRLSPHLGQLAKLRPASLTLARATYYFSHRRATADLGYQPLYTVDEAMDQTAQFLRKNGALP